MRFLFPLIAVALLVVSCFMPWMTIESKGITISGIDAREIGFGRPGYLHFVFAGLYLIFLLINKAWARGASMVFATFNIAWALRNFFMAVCPGGDCPTRRTGLYLLLFASAAMFIAGLFVPIREKETTEYRTDEQGISNAEK